MKILKTTVQLLFIIFIVAISIASDDYSLLIGFGIVLFISYVILLAWKYIRSLILLVMIVSLGSCSKEEEINNQLDTSLSLEIEDRLAKVGLKKVDRSFFPENAKIDTITSNEELDSILRIIENLGVPFPGGDTIKIELPPVTTAKSLIKQPIYGTLSDTPITNPSILFQYADDSGPGTFTTQTKYVRNSATADYTYPWCDLTLEVSGTAARLVNVTPEAWGFMNLYGIVTATGGIGGFIPAPPVTAIVVSGQGAAIFVSSGVLYAGVYYNNNYYGNSGTIEISGYILIDNGAGVVSFTPLN